MKINKVASITFGSLIIIAVIGYFYLFGGVQSEVIKHIPEDADFVMIVNNKKVAAKLFETTLKDPNGIQRFSDLIDGEADGEMTDNGLDFLSKLVLFSFKESSGRYVVLGIDIRNYSIFENYLAQSAYTKDLAIKEVDGVHIRYDKKNSLLPGSLIVYNEKVAMYVAPMKDQTKSASVNKDIVEQVALNLFNKENETWTEVSKHHYNDMYYQINPQSLKDFVGDFAFLDVLEKMEFSMDFEEEEVTFNNTIFSNQNEQVAHFMNSATKKVKFPDDRSFFSFSLKVEQEQLFSFFKNNLGVKRIGAIESDIKKLTQHLTGNITFEWIGNHFEEVTHIEYELDEEFNKTSKEVKTTVLVPEFRIFLEAKDGHTKPFMDAMYGKSRTASEGVFNTPFSYFINSDLYVKPNGNMIFFSTNLTDFEHIESIETEKLNVPVMSSIHIQSLLNAIPKPKTFNMEYNTRLMFAQLFLEPFKEVNMIGNIRDESSMTFEGNLTFKNKVGHSVYEFSYMFLSFLSPSR